jgi:hypothetical protein
MGGETGHSEALREERGKRNDQVRQQSYFFPLYRRSYRAKLIGVELSEHARKVIGPTLQLFSTWLGAELPLCQI